MPRSTPLVALAILAALLVSTDAVAHGDTVGPRAAALTPAGCEGAPIAATQVITGSFTTAQQGSYVMVPFNVPAGTTEVRTKLCFDQPPPGADPIAKHTIDLGLWDSKPTSGPWGTAQFRGWGGSSHPDVQITPQGFSSAAQYAANPKANVPGLTTRGFVPGPIPAGTWAAELGVAAVVPADPDGVAWRLEIQTSSDPTNTADPYRPATYDTRPAKRSAGWYAGDLHVHAEHSALGDASMKDVFDYAFGPAKLDFITLSDYVSTPAWGEIGRYQAQYPGRLIARAAEVITYRGHIQNHSATYVDHRTGPVLDRSSAGTLTPERAGRPASSVFDAIHAAGGFTQINHPKIFPPERNPLNAILCRGCAWEYSDAETNFRKVDAIEIDTGLPAIGGKLNLFTADAIAFYQHALATGAHVAAIGSSDSHSAGVTKNPAIDAPLGVATTVVYAKRLSEQGIEDAVKAHHTYVKLFGNRGPDLRLDAVSGRRRAMMGDTLRGRSATLTAKVSGARASAIPLGSGPYTLVLERNGRAIKRVTVKGARMTSKFSVSRSGRYGLTLKRADLVVAMTTPVWLQRP